MCRLLLKSTIQLLRFHFSIFLLPVYLFALSELPDVNLTNAILVFICLHGLVYPSSNGYNSYMDKDQTPIGGLATPLFPTRQLFYASVIMDLFAIVIALFISEFFALGIFVYITASRAYSYKGIRLKKYPIIGFLTVFIFQGAAIFYITYHGVHPMQVTEVPVLPCFISSCLIGALYPLTQIYQHEADKKDGVQTISMLLGKRGTFLLSMFLFLTATILLYLHFQQEDQPNNFIIYLLVMFPVVLFFIYWMVNVWKQDSKASFTNSMRMNVLASVCSCIVFLLFIILKH